MRTAGSERRGVRRRAVAWLLWGAALVLVPITSLPLLRDVIGPVTVVPLSMVPVALLVLVWLIPNLVRGGLLPKPAVPLAAFLLVALAASATATFLDIRPILGQDMLGREARGLVTLLAGFAFYLVAATLPQSEGDLSASLRWIYAGGIVLLVYSSIQAWFVLSNATEIPATLREFHRMLVMRDPSADRVSGFAFEPSWLADQLVLLYIPLWLASTLRGYSVFSPKRKRLSPEAGLLLWGVGILFLSSSRIGLLAFLFVIGVVGVYGSFRLSQAWAERAWRAQGRKASVGSPPALYRVVLMIVLVAVIAAALLSMVSLGAQLDPRLARLFTTTYGDLIAGQGGGLYELANRLAYAERVMYWTTAYRAFSLHPILGVGLGNAGFFFRETLPAVGTSLPEMIRILNGSPEFPNAKSLWFRLLGETGILGFLCFVTWIIIVFLGARALAGKHQGVMGVLGLAGMLALGALLVEGFSLDTFALPQLWLIPGLVTAALALTAANPASRG